MTFFFFIFFLISIFSKGWRRFVLNFCIRSSGRKGWEGDPTQLGWGGPADAAEGREGALGAVVGPGQPRLAWADSVAPAVWGRLRLGQPVLAWHAGLLRQPVLHGWGRGFLVHPGLPQPEGVGSCPTAG